MKTKRSSGKTILNILFFISIFSMAAGYAQSSRVPLLERVISVSFEQERLDVALKKISQQAGFTFSYNPSIIEAEKTVSYTFTNKSVREILDQLFKGTIQYKERSRYIILTKAEISAAPKDIHVLSGYVIDESTGRRLKNVSVYDPVSLSSAITNAYGYFQIEVENPSGEEVKLAVNKFNYTDTLVVVPSDNARLLNIPIRINREKIATLADSVGKKIRRFWKTKVLTEHKALTEQEINMQNINDTLYRKTQLSLIPFIGTNHKLSGNVINDFSLNIWGGYSLGVRKLEIGGLFNTVRGDVEGAQFAGFFNGVLGKRKGWQMAGIFNATRDSSSGAQLAGMLNVNLNSSNDFAAAGLLNFTYRDSRGVKLAGFGNLTVGAQQGPHLAGLFNFSTKDTGPAQIAGLLNFTAGRMDGAQVAGLVNFAAGEIKGAQVSGWLNIAPKKITGTQVSGGVNYATHIKGTQFGPINIADSIDGVPIGIFSFVVKGYHKIEVSADEIFYTNIAFRTGVQKFYNIFTAGIKPEDSEENFWTFGYGIGTSPKLGRKLYLNVDLTANQVVYGNSFDAINMLNKLYLGLEFQATKKFAVTLGTTLNGYITDTTHDTYPDLFTDYTPHLIYNNTYSNDLNLKMWLGGKIGLRFL